MDNQCEEVSIFKHPWKWFQSCATSTRAKVTLFSLSFAESTVFPIIVDPLLAALTLAKPRKWIFFSLLTTIASVLGGVAGYLVGVFFFETLGVRLIEIYSLQEQFTATRNAFNDGTFWVILFGAVTPIPYKLFVLTGGLLEVNFAAFLAASIVGRGARFFLVGFMVARFGERALERSSWYINLMSAVVILAVVLWIISKFL